MKSVAQETVGLLVGRVHRRLQHQIVTRLEPYNLTPQQLWIVLMVFEGVDLASRDIAERINMEKATASRLVDKLVRRGWLKMTPDPADKRRLRLELTPTGQREGKKLRQMAVQLDDQMIHGLGKARLDALCDGLRQVLGNLA